MRIIKGDLRDARIIEFLQLHVTTARAQTDPAAHTFLTSAAYSHPA
jgi:hypothetical protein